MLTEMSCDKVNGTLESYINNNNNNDVSNKQQVNDVSEKKYAEVPLQLEEEMEKQKSLVILGSIFIAGILALVYIYKNFPEMEE
jgi:hypothetical protein